MHVRISISFNEIIFPPLDHPLARGAEQLSTTRFSLSQTAPARRGRATEGHGLAGQWRRSFGARR